MKLSKELTLLEIQKGELEVLKKIKQICDEIGLNYFLFCGTLIGAVRHKGIIPWDDDIDVGMMREDYEKFVSYCASHSEDLLPFQLYHYTTNKDYIYPIARFVDTRYTIDYEGYRDYNLGLFVDLYPIDGCGNSIEERNAIFHKVRDFVIPLISLGARKSVLYNHGIVNYITKSVLRRVALIIGQNRLLRIIDNRAKRYCPKSSKYVMCVIWDNFRSSFFPSECFEEFIEVPFEDGLFKVPRKYDEILKLVYGDYMKLPPEEERIGHHYYKAYKKES